MRGWGCAAWARWARAGAGVAASLGLAALAWAQTENETQQAATPDRLAPIKPGDTRLGETGIQVGAFVVSPRVYVGVLHNDNVLAREVDEQDDWALAVDADAEIVSTWRRHSLGLELEADSLTYQDLDTENQFNYSVAARGAYEINSANYLTGRAGYSELTEGRDSINFDFNGREPIEYNVTNLEAGAGHQFARTLVELTAGWRDVDFDPLELVTGEVLDNNGRDYDGVFGAVDVSRAFHAGYDGFVRLEVDNRDYSAATSSARDSDGLGIRFGLRANITDLIAGEAYVGYIKRDYDGFPSTDGFSFGANVGWTPTRAWRIGLEGLRSIGEASGTAQAAFLSTTLELTAMRSVSERLLLGPTIGYRKYELEGGGRNDEIVTLGFTGRFAVARNISIDAGYFSIDRESNVVGGDFDQDRFTIGVSLRR